MEANGAAWTLLLEQQKEQRRRLTTVENAVRTNAERTLRQEDGLDERFTRIDQDMATLKADVASIKATIKVVGGGFVLLCTFLAVILARVIA